jgi:Flp pilus assembly protein TadG
VWSRIKLKWWCEMNPIESVKRLFARRDGAIAVEAALSLSLLMVMSLGGLDIVRYYQLVGRMERAAATTADLVSRGETVRDRLTYDLQSETSDIGTYFTLAALSAQPEPLSASGGTVIAALTGTAGAPAVHWVRGTGPLADGAAQRLSNLTALPADIPFVAVEISLPFDTLILGKAGALAGVDVDTVLRRIVFMRPREASLERLEPVS